MSWLGFEFAVRNPEGVTSEWVEFSYPFDFIKLRETVDRNAVDGRRLSNAGQYAEAVEPFRKAMTFSDRILGEHAEETETLRREWNGAIDAAARSRLHFDVGDRVSIKDGHFAGTRATVKEIWLRHYAPYIVTTDEGMDVQIRDEDLESGNT